MWIEKDKGLHRAGPCWYGNNIKKELYGKALLFSHAFQFLVLTYSFIQLCQHPVEEIGAAFVLALLYGGVISVTFLGLKTEELVEYRGHHFQRGFSVVDAAHLVDAVDQFHEVDGIACPLQVRCRDSGSFFRRVGWSG